MRNRLLLLGACCLGALFACSDSGPTLSSDEGEIILQSVDGAAISGRPTVVDSVLVTAEIRLGPDAPAVERALLVADGTVMAIRNVQVAPGGTAVVTLSTHDVPSGTRRVQVQATAAGGSVVAASPELSITVTRPRSHVRVLRVNGAPPPREGAFAAVADSFVVDLVVVTADDEPAPDQIVMSRDTSDFFVRTLGGAPVSMEPGRTYRIPFVAWIAVPGRYSVTVDVERFLRDPAGAIEGVEVAGSSGRIPVSVTSSDVTPPVIHAPANELVTSGQQVSFQASDERGVWQHRLEVVGRCAPATSIGRAGPRTTANLASTVSLCLLPGPNRVIRRAVDTAGNVTSDEVIIRLVPPAGASASRAPQPERTVVRQMPNGVVEQMLVPAGN